MARKMIILVLALACGVFAPLPALARSPVVGVFDLLPTNEVPATPELAKPEVEGLSARFRWRTIQPRPDEYDWTLIDEALARAREHGKKAMIRVTAGVHTPTWVYDLGAASVTVDDNTVPVVWDPIYLLAWKNFISVLGSRYGNHADLLSLHMTGVGMFGEMSISLPGVDWPSYGYTDEKYVAAWITVINAYRQAFPQKPTHLAINPPFPGMVAAMVGVVHYCLSTYPREVLIQANDLRESGSAYSNAIRQAGLRTWVGYQMFGGREWQDAETGDRATAFRKGLADGMVYTEVYQGDLQDETLDAAVRKLAAGLILNSLRPLGRISLSPAIFLLLLGD
ncbi:MAG: hypothetical protein FJ128_13015 [Deltaproteobacteria bacterium]|nr:hypothetical protein [Deltaproteobacteria bacterium]